MPVRQAFAGSVQILQALCGDCHSEKTLRERAAHKFGEPCGPAQAAFSGFCADVRKGRAVRRRGRGALQAQRAFPCPSCARRTALSPWTACCRTWALWRTAATAVLPESVAVRGARLVPEGFAGPRCWTACRWDHISARSHRGNAAARAGGHGRRVARRRRAHGQARKRDDRRVALYSVRSSSSELDGADADFSQAFAYERGMVGVRLRARLLSNCTYRPIRRGAGL